MLAAALGGRNYAVLTTFRRNGQVVPTAIWFVLAGDDEAYFMTGPETGKAKRIRKNPAVRIAPSNPRGKPLGPAVEARARPLHGTEAEAAQRALAKKYGLQWTIFGIMAQLRRSGKPVFYAAWPAV
jgi:PPOX class probable F420-dependent enzyme